MFMLYMHALAPQLRIPGAAFNAANKLALVRSAVITQETATAVAVDA